MSALSIMDNLAAARMLGLLNMPFKSWKAFELGVIDEMGKTVRRPRTPDERKSWTYLHRVIRKVKQLLDRVPGLRIASTIYALREHLTEEEYQTLVEAVTSGDSADIAAGTTTGAVAGPGPEIMKDKKKKKILKLDEFIRDVHQIENLIVQVEQLVKSGKKLSRRELDTLSKQVVDATSSPTIRERDIDKLEDLLSKLQ